MFSQADTNIDKLDKMDNDGAQQASGPSWASRLKWAFLLVLGLTLLAAIIFAGMYQYVYRDRVFLGVSVLQTDLGGQTRDEARHLIDAEIQRYLGSPLALQYNGRTWQTTPGDLGADFDQEATLGLAFDVGRGGGLIDQLSSQLQTWRGGETIRPRFALNQARQNAAFDNLAKEIDKPASDAVLTLEGNKLTLVASQNGLTLDRDALSQALNTAFAEMANPPIKLPVTEVRPSVTEADLQPVKSKAEAMIGSPVTVHFAGQDTVWQNGLVQKQVEKSWSLSGDQIAGMLSIVSSKDGSGKPKTDLALDQEKLTAFGTDLAKDIERRPINARFDFQDGKLVPIRDSVDGRTVDVPKLVSLLTEKAAATEGRTVELPVKLEKPAVATEDMSKIVIKDKIVEKSTSYAGSVPERAHNVRWGASLLDGVVVAPGQEFSFLDEVGDITYAAGFQTGFAIVGSDTVPDPGGGICQVSTTLFQTVFYGGYEILERYPHAYRMVRYEPPAGLDATVYEGQLDFRFRNNSDNYVLIQSRSDDSRIYFSLWGIAPTWQVTVDGPYLSNFVPADRTLITRQTSGLAKGRTVQVEEPQDGVDVTIKRKVTQDGQVVTSDSFFSRYRPEGNVVLVGTGN